jgi:hypothetical protein
MTKVSKDTFNDLSEKKYLLFRKCVCVVVQFLVLTSTVALANARAVAI